MWFRIETEKDGTIRSCEQVDVSFRNKGHVFYIEADSKVLALSKVKTFIAARERLNERRRDKEREYRSLGLCAECGASDTGGFAKCAKHRALDRAQEKRRRKGETKTVVVLPAEDRALAKSRRDSFGKKLRRATQEDKAILRTLVLMRRVYLEDPDNFMGWLSAEILMVEKRIGAKSDGIRGNVRPQVGATAAE